MLHNIRNKANPFFETYSYNLYANNRFKSPPVSLKAHSFRIVLAAPNNPTSALISHLFPKQNLKLGQKPI